MIRKDRISLIVLFTLMVSTVYAQLPGKEETGFVYRSEWSGNAVLHTNGWGLDVRYGKFKGAKKRLVYSAGFTTMKHPQETKVYNPYYEDSKGYIYGKLNSLTLIKPQFGIKKVRFQKFRDQGVEIGTYWSVGPTLGLVKPIYLEIGHSSSGSIQYDYISVERYDPEKHFIDNIYGKAPGTKGWSEMKIYPGLSARYSVYFEYSPDDDGLKGLEAGAAIDAFHKRVPIIANEQNRQFYLTLYVSLFFGKKYF